MSEGRLYVCATPIGNLGDVSDRLREVLSAADIVYAEDTRRTGKLLQHIGAGTRIKSLFVGNERERTAQLLDDLSGGATVALVSDAGMPTVSDPGVEAVRLARDRGFAVTVIPGASAVTTALALSGFGGDRFVFEGFLPRKGKDRAERLADLAAENRVVVLFASPHRVGSDLAALRDAVGPDRKVTVARELTKLHEEVWTGSLDEAASRFSGEVKGEFTLVLGPVEPRESAPDDGIEQARKLIEQGASTSEAARRAATETGVSRRVIYQALLSDQGET